MAREFLIRTAEDLGRVIRQARNETGLTQAELAAFVGADRVYVGRVERGAESRRLDRVLRTLQGLGYDLVAVPRRGRGRAADDVEAER
jgi:HTH-type transcriptional regulator/antitoxin HipB